MDLETFKVDPAMSREMADHFHDALPAVFDVPTLLIAIGMLQLAVKHPVFEGADLNPLAPANVARRIIDSFIDQLREIGMEKTAAFYEAAGRGDNPADRWMQ